MQYFIYRFIVLGCTDSFFCLVVGVFLSLHFRLRLSPSPPPSKVTVTRTSALASGHSHTSRLLHPGAAPSSSRNSSGSKKRRLNDNESETSSMVGATVTKTRISQHASASGCISVDEIDLDGKFVRLSNKADEVSGMQRDPKRAQIKLSSVRVGSNGFYNCARDRLCIYYRYLKLA